MITSWINNESPMVKIIDLEKFRAQKAEEHGFSLWKKRFGETFHSKTRFSDLSNQTLLFLSTPGEDNIQAFNEVIFETLDLGNQKRLDMLDSEQKMEVLDIQLFLADRARFEIMSRLDWLQSYPEEQQPIKSLLLDFDQYRYKSFKNPPLLSPDHSEFEHFQKLINREKEVFIRKLFTNALSTFKEYIKDTDE